VGAGCADTTDEKERAASRTITLADQRDDTRISFDDFPASAPIRRMTNSLENPFERTRIDAGKAQDAASATRNDSRDASDPSRK
jgi:hypothetical protein